MTTVRFGFELDSGKLEIDDGKVVCCVRCRGGVFILPLHKISTRQFPACHDVSWQVAEKKVGHSWQAIGRFGQQHKGDMHEDRGAAKDAVSLSRYRQLARFATVHTAGFHNLRNREIGIALLHHAVMR